jgi:hypothetical protein
MESIECKSPRDAHLPENDYYSEASQETLTFPSALLSEVEVHEWEMDRFLDLLGTLHM